ncbi:MAG: hypothetical protein ABJ327_12000 [Litoreibacter sp.]
MSSELSAFTAINGIEDVYTAQKGGLRCSAVRLKGGNLCLYSPVLGLGAVALESLSNLGEVSHLLAPNHYHHKGIKEFKSVFSKATLCCTSRAMPRLEKQTDLRFQDLDNAALHLPDHITLIEPQGLKTGEVWLQVVSNSQTLWIVTDAFCGAKGPIGKVVDQPALLGTFPRYGIADLGAYLDWLSCQIEKNKPTMIAPCHGSLIANNFAGDLALELVKRLASEK